MSASMGITLLSITSVILTAFFIFAGSIKVFGWQKTIFEVQLKFFESYGLNRPVMALVGVIEISGALTLWFSGYLGLLGALALAATSAGAIFFHLVFDSWKNAIPAMVTLVLSAYISLMKSNVIFV